VSESEVHFFEIVGQEHCDSRGVVKAGCLLQWMDICACLSAEKHGQLSAVTLSMDELSFDSPIESGSTIEITAHVNNAFNTSMEVEVQVISVASHPAKMHCRGYFTFVSLDHEGKKGSVPKVIPETETERDNFILAKERRAMRFKRKDMIQKLMVQKELSQSGSEDPVTRRPLMQRGPSGGKEDSTAPAEWTGKKRGSVRRAVGQYMAAQLATPLELTLPMLSSAVEMTKVVLPSDANHMGNTFGGNIMSWMDSAGTVAALKHCRHSEKVEGVNVVTIAVDAMAFLGSSTVGDRITCHAQVNRVFGSTMEVGVRVEAQAIGCRARHINTGYLTIMAIDEKTNKPVTAPKVEGDTPGQVRQYEQALGRRRLRMERKTLKGEEKKGLAWSWSEEMSSEISVANIYGLLKVANDYNLIWQPQDLKGLGGRFEMRMDVNKNTFGQDIMTIRISGLVSCDMKKMHELIMDVQRRSEWDLIIAGTDVKEVIDEHNDIVWTAYPSISEPGKITDYSLLRTWKSDEDRYIIASRSVAHPAVPVNTADTNYIRGEVNPSGFVLTPWSMDDGMGRDDEVAMQTSFDYLVQLDKDSQKMLGGGGGKKATDSKAVQVMVGSLVKLCSLLASGP
jgi:acyl-CoA thioesterase 11